MSINGRTYLACTAPLKGLREPVELLPLPGFPVIRDLVVDMTRFFEQYRSIEQIKLRMMRTGLCLETPR